MGDSHGWRGDQLESLARCHGVGRCGDTHGNLLNRPGGISSGVSGGGRRLRGEFNIIAMTSVPFVALNG